MIWRYAVTGGHLVRWDGEVKPASRPAGLQVLIPHGWSTARCGLAAYLWSDTLTDVGPDEATARMIKACSPAGVDDAALRGWRPAVSASGARWVVSPPIAMGAPRFPIAGQTRAAE